MARENPLRRMSAGLMVLIAAPPFSELQNTTLAERAFRERFPDPLLPPTVSLARPSHPQACPIATRLG
jgi:hypothetical protein